MSLGHGASIVRNGLVFAYDMSNPKKSWKGAPTTNLVGSNFFNGNGVNFTVNQNVTDIMPDGTLGIARELNAQIVSDPNRTVSIGSYSLTAGATYTLSFYAKNINCTGFSGNLYSPTLLRVIGGITYPTLNTVTWTRVVTTFTVPNEGPNPVTLSPQVFRDGGTGLFRLCWLMLEQQLFDTPYVSSSRSNTQTLLDWTGNNTITANSLTYNSDGTFSFNGSSDYISVPLTVIGSQRNNFTIETWVKFTSSSNSNVIFNAKGQNLYPRIFKNSSNAIVAQYRPTGSSVSITSSSTVSLNSYCHIVFTYDSVAGGNLYLNGSLVASNTSTLGTHEGGTSGNMLIGQDTNLSYFANGEIGITRLYDKTLSSGEVSQNFNALRGRYGI